MKKKIVTMLIVGALSVGMLAGCSKNDGNTTDITTTVAPTEATTPAVEVTPEVTEAPIVTEEPEVTEAPVEDVVDQETLDKMAADEVAALIDAIYVQTRNENTDEQCAAAKTAWDALTDAQKELVEGDEADPDYFGRDTGDASLDDALNQDGIGENELLVVSFGTSFNNSRVEDISGVEKALAAAYPEWSVRRAFTAQIIINHIQARDGVKIDNMEQAMERAVANGVKNLVIQPTHLMHGAEYDELMEAVAAYADKIENIVVAEPLLGQVGSVASEVNSDKEAAAIAITEKALETAGYESTDAAAADGVAFVFMGHGTSHTAKVTYSQMQEQMNLLGYTNVFIGTVEGEPEETACEAVIEAVANAGFKKVILRPLMVVAGDHANNDMAGEDEDSWKSMFEASEKFDSVDAQIAGLGGIEAIQNIYIQHTADAIELLGTASAGGNSGVEVTDLADGWYEAEFKTDSSMFHINEALNGKCDLIVSDGKMVAHITLASTSITNLYEGLAEDAVVDEANVLQPTEDEVEYEDGTVETVYGFDINVPYLNGEFDLAILGKKGTWYDHKVSVTNVQIPEDAATNYETYAANVTLVGGTGKATIESPAMVTMYEYGPEATLVWTSKNYDYMIVGGEKYYNLAEEGEPSVFQVPVVLGEEMDVIADTIAMSEPHEIEYKLTLDFIFE